MNYDSRCRRWTPRETNILREMWRPGIRPDDETLEKLCKLVRRSEGAVANKASDLGLRRPKVKHYTEAEDKKIKKYYETRPETMVAFAKRLGVTPSSVRRRARKLGLLETHYERYARESEKPKQIKCRKCLRCSREFMSKGAGNRICKSCRDSRAFKTAPDYTIAI